MAILAPLLAPLIGLGSLGLVGEAIVGIGLSFGLSYLSNKLKPQTSGSSQAKGAQLSLGYSVNEPREIPFGYAPTKGWLKYHNTYGPNGNDYVQLVYKLGDIPCDGLEAVYGAGKKLTLGAKQILRDGRGNLIVSGQPVAEYPGVMWIEFHNGEWDQEADEDLVAKASGTPYSANRRGRGVCYARVTMKSDNEKYKNGIPDFLWVIRGGRFYDWRKDSTAGGSGSHRWGDESTYEWTRNGAVITYNYKRGVYVHGHKVGGMNCPAVSMPIAVWTAAANICDEEYIKKDGSKEPRYCLDGILAVDSDHGTVVRDFKTCMAGELSDSGGVFKLYPGAAQASVMTITDDDLIAGVPVRYIPKLPRDALVNTVFGSFTDPSQLYNQGALPPRASLEDREADGGAELVADYSFPYVQSGTQGQRAMEIYRREGRFQRNLGLTLRARAAVLESCDWITWNSKRYGFEGMKFRVLQSKPNNDLTVPIEIRETSNSVFAFSSGTDEIDPLTPHDVGAGGDRLASVQGLKATTVLLDGEGFEQAPALRVDWTPIDDTTVTQLKLEWRKVGDAVSMETTVLNPAAGNHYIVSGIMGGIQYEVRMSMVTMPERATVATAWEPTNGVTDPQVVAVAAVAQSVPPKAITPAMLSDQVRQEIAMAVAKEETFGSVNERLAEIWDAVTSLADSASAAMMSAEGQGARISEVRQIVQTNVESLARQILELSAELDGNVATAVQDITTRVAAVETVAGSKNRVFRQATTPTATAAGDLWINTNESNRLYRANGPGTSMWMLSEDQRVPALQSTTSALSTSLTELATRVGDNESSTFDLAESLDGIRARRTLGVNSNGNVALIDLDGNEYGSAITFVGDTFYFAHPDVASGAPLPILVIKTVAGQKRFVFTGQMLVDAITSGEASFTTLASITSKLGRITSGYIGNEPNTSFWDLDTGDFQIG
ncbi:hypothetical protein [Hyphomicrobium sp. ghe19]|uniref:hypothetical protein n=1 Tax=Hyphomicrobium sp. ghe19 TaxID=2682968 RepID=UPI0013668697|nr:hypothetical protein HYPP_03761 [Hyphomicrobium sp. ghe19]